MSRILIVEDEEAIADLEKDYLELSSFEVEIETDGQQGLEKALKNDFDMIILDIMLPGVDGFEICKQIREAKEIPILMVSARKEDIDKIRVLGLGADDYITKPFSIHSLQRKVENVLRMMRHHVSMQDVFDDGRLFLNFAEQTALLGGKPLTLSTLEFRMLNLFCQNRNRVLTRKQLLEKIWDCTENYVDEHTLTTTLSRIRGKIETDGTVYIKTVYGMGYKWTGGEPA